LLALAETKLAPDWREPNSPDGLVLLFRSSPSGAAPASSEFVFTPSQLKQRFESSYVIEIELLDPDRNPVPGENWVLLLPDGSRRSGRLDQRGYVKITDVPESGCQVCFPRLDARAWSPCT
jgi:hypothetical protein